MFRAWGGRDLKSAVAQALKRLPVRFEPWAVTIFWSRRNRAL